MIKELKEILAKTDKTGARPLIFVDIRRVLMTNSAISTEKINKMIKNFNVAKMPPVTGLLLRGDYGIMLKLTDGNHRTEVLRRLGDKNVPAVPLTPEEYKHVAYSKTNTIDLTYYIPKEPIFI